MMRFGTVVMVMTALVVLGGERRCRADVPPLCSDLDTLITCAQADVGKPCQGGGQCYFMSCGAGSAVVQPTAVYKCAVCPSVVATSDAGCTSYSQLQMPCGAGGTCAVLPSYCVTATTPKLACVGPTPPQPTGPPSGEGGAGGSSPGAGGQAGSAAGGASGAPGAGGSSGAGGASGAPGAGGRAAGGTSGSGATAGSGNGGGCDVVPRVPSAGIAVFALLLIGLLALVVDRRRRRR